MKIKSIQIDEVGVKNCPDSINSLETAAGITGLGEFYCGASIHAATQFKVFPFKTQRQPVISYER